MHKIKLTNNECEKISGGRIDICPLTFDDGNTYKYFTVQFCLSGRLYSKYQIYVSNTPEEAYRKISNLSPCIDEYKLSLPNYGCSKNAIELMDIVLK